jgi:hypothetical protein
MSASNAIYRDLHCGFEPTISILGWSKNIFPLHLAAQHLTSCRSKLTEKYVKIYILP